jgi:hypothetical protein
MRRVAWMVRACLVGDVGDDDSGLGGGGGDGGGGGGLCLVQDHGGDGREREVGLDEHLGSVEPRPVRDFLRQGRAQCGATTSARSAVPMAVAASDGRAPKGAEGGGGAIRAEGTARASRSATRHSRSSSTSFLSLVNERMAPTFSGCRHTHGELSKRTTCHARKVGVAPQHCGVEVPCGEVPRVGSVRWGLEMGV